MRIHFRHKKPKCAAALNLGRIQGDVGVLEKTNDRAQVAARDIHAHANADDDFVLADPIELAHRFDDASNKSRGVFSSAYSGLENDEFVAADAGDRLAVAHDLQESRVNGCQEMTLPK